MEAYAFNRSIIDPSTDENHYPLGHRLLVERVSLVPEQRPPLLITIISSIFGQVLLQRVKRLLRINIRKIKF